MSAKTLQAAVNRTPAEFYHQLTRELAALDRDAKAYAWKVGALSSALTRAVKAVAEIENVATSLEKKRIAAATSPIVRAVVVPDVDFSI